VGAAANSRADTSFGVHFLGNTTDPVTGTAGVVPIGNWNNFDSTFTTGTITGSDGSSTATLTLSGAIPNGGWNSGGTTPDGGNGSLMDGYLDAANNTAGSNHQITNVISGLTGGHYDVYIYNYSDASHPSSAADWLPNYSINGVSYSAPQLGNGTSSYTSSGAAVGGPFTNFVQATTYSANFESTPPLASAFGNYFKAPAVVPAAGGTITIVEEADNNSWRSPLNGYELVPVAGGTPPIIGVPSEFPASGTVTPGGVVNLSASASGTGPITFQWETDGGSGGAFSPISNATGTNLVVNTTGFAAGTYAYNLVAANSFGSVTSLTADVVVAAPYSAPAPAIGIQFRGNGNSKALTPLQLAGYVPVEFWNVDSLATGSTATNLVDYSGASSALTVSATYHNGTWYTGTGNLPTPTPDDILMSGGFWSASGFAIGVTNVPYSAYDVYVYMLNDNNPNRRYELDLNGTQTNYGSVFNGNTQTGYPPYTFDVERTQLPNGVQAHADLVVFTNITGTAFQINGTTPDGTVAMEAIEIVNSFVGPAMAGQISVYPAGQLYTGSPLVLRENTVSGAQPLTYQWYSDNGTGGALTPVAGATGPTYTVNTASLTAGNYQYQVAVTNSLGGSISAVQSVSITASAPFVVNDISVVPTNEVYVGEPVTLTATFAGTTPISLQWMKDTGAGPQPVSGATGNTLSLKNPQISDSGTYSLRANNNIGGPVYTSSSMLTVVPNLLPPASSYAYGAKVLSFGPLAYWPLDDTNDPSTGGSPAYDASGNGYYGAYGEFSENGFGSLAVGPQAPQFPGFPTVNGALGCLWGNESSYVDAPLGTISANNLTYVAWIYPISSLGPVGTFTGILFDRGGPGSGLGFGGATDSTGMPELGYTWNNASATWGWNSYLYPTSDQWNFVAMTLTPTGTTLYLVNQAGVVQSTNNVLAQAPGEFGVDLHIGNDGGTVSRTFNGNISSAAVFLTALSSNQIVTLADVGLGITPPPPSNVTVNISKSGSTPGSLTINWSQGTLLQSTNVSGPWTTNGSASPYTVAPTNAHMFFRVQVQ
jgi:hypothetical protein